MSTNHLMPMPIIVGSPRSGTTLVRLMLDAHPDLAIPPETGFLPSIAERSQIEPAATVQELIDLVTRFPPDAPAWKDFQIPGEDYARHVQGLDPFSLADGVRAFYRMYAARCGKSRWGDKTPLYCRYLAELEAFLPEARFVHIVRDGRDVAVSLRSRWFSPGHDIRVQAEYWRINVLAGRQDGAACANYLEVRYEDVVRQPEPTLRTICDFLELAFDPQMLRWHERAPERLAEHLTRRTVTGQVIVTHEERIEQQRATLSALDPSKIGVWRTHLDLDERRIFTEVAGDVLALFGYGE